MTKGLHHNYTTYKLPQKTEQVKDRLDIECQYEISEIISNILLCQPMLYISCNIKSHSYKLLKPLLLQNISNMSTNLLHMN